MVVPVEQEGKVCDCSSRIGDAATQGATSSGSSRKAGGKKMARGSQQVCSLTSWRRGAYIGLFGEVSLWLFTCEYLWCN